jgi:hypothetical protein
VGIKLEISATAECDICRKSIKTQMGMPKVINDTSEDSLQTYNISVYSAHSPSLCIYGHKVYDQPQLIMCNKCYSEYLTKKQIIEDEHAFKTRHLINDMKSKHITE